MRPARLLAVGCGVLVAVGLTSPVAALGAATPAVTASPISVPEGQSFSGIVGTISPCPATGPNGDVLISWGDGSPDAEATLASDGTPSECSVAPLAAHAYLAAGTYNTEISYAYAVGVQPATGSSTASVSDASISLTAGKLNGVAGTQIKGALADLDDSGGLLPPADYTVTIAWGDGSRSPGSVNRSGEVIGAHTYAAPGSYSPQVVVVDEGGQRASTTATVVVALPGCTATPPKPGSGYSPTAGAPNGRWVQAVYHDLLGRQPSPAELTAFTSALSAGATREQIALDVENSAEGLSDLVVSLFKSYLQRTPTSPELNTLTQQLTSGGTAEGLVAQLLGSPEYLAKRGGGSVAGFLGALWCDTLDRSMTQSDFNFGSQAIAGGMARTALAKIVLTSAEYRQDLVQRLFLRFLRRAPTASEEQFYVQELVQGASDQQVIADLLGSQEYFNKFKGAGPTLTGVEVTNAGVIHLTLGRPATIEMVVLKVRSGAQARDAATRRLLGSRDERLASGPLPVVRRIGIVDFGRHPAGEVTIHWRLRVNGQPLKSGHYLLLIQARVRDRLSDVSNPIPITIR